MRKPIVSIFACLALNAICGEVTPHVEGDVYTFSEAGEYSGSITGSKTIVMAGSGTLTLKGLGDGFTGSFVIRNGGVLTADTMAHFGAPTAITVENGGQFKTPESSAGGLTTADVTFCGAGPDGSGAIYVQSQNNIPLYAVSTIAADYLS